jgi:hypothetical protein
MREYGASSMLVEPAMIASDAQPLKHMASRAHSLCFTFGVVVAVYLAFNNPHVMF